jgi:hypothetical protein
MKSYSYVYVNICFMKIFPYFRKNFLIMTIQDRTVDFLENLEAIKARTFLTDAYKETLNFNLKLSSVKPPLPFIEVTDETDYKNIIKHIVSEINNPNFIFSTDDYQHNKKYLYLGM